MAPEFCFLDRRHAGVTSVCCTFGSSSPCTSELHRLRELRSRLAPAYSLVKMPGTLRGRRLFSAFSYGSAGPAKDRPRPMLLNKKCDTQRMQSGSLHGMLSFLDANHHSTRRHTRADRSRKEHRSFNKAMNAAKQGKRWGHVDVEACVRVTVTLRGVKLCSYRRLELERCRKAPPTV
jgi:hypothetical protein